MTVTEATSDEEKLVSLAQAGDRRAYERLVERHSGVVHRVAARIVGPSDADDVSQDTFVRAYYRLHQYRGTGSFRSWLLQVTRSVALNSLSRRHPQPMADMEDLMGADRDGAQSRPASSLEDKERRERLEYKVTRLTERHRTVLVLRDIEGFSYEEIAAITETPVGSVKGRLHRARAEMIDLLRRNTYDWELPDD